MRPGITGGILRSMGSQAYSALAVLVHKRLNEISGVISMDFVVLGLNFWRSCADSQQRSSLRAFLSVLGSIVKSSSSLPLLRAQQAATPPEPGMWLLFQSLPGMGSMFNTYCIRNGVTMEEAQTDILTFLIRLK